MPSRRHRQRILVLGAGVFGLPAAIELARRGHAVRLVDVGPLPNPLAASNDPSRLVRADYGSDPYYRDLMLAALPMWGEWNARWGEMVFHADGLLVSATESFDSGGFEAASLASLAAAGLAPVTLTGSDLERRFPAWRSGGRRHGYFNPHGGWAAAGRTLVHLLDDAADAGVTLIKGRVLRFVEDTGQLRGVDVTEEASGAADDRRATPTAVRSAVDDEGAAARAGEVRLDADLTLVAAGAWTPKLLPNLADRFVVTGHPLLYFQLAPEQVPAFQPPHFVSWTADISATGWYGFPALDDGRLKIGRHGPGRPMDPDEPRRTTDEDEARAREFLAANLPAAADAPLVASRLCLYCDSPDGDFLVAHDPDRPGLVVASGDSGHGFKFAPVLGGIVADVVEGRPNPWAKRWAWRAGPPRRREESRWLGEPG